MAILSTLAAIGAAVGVGTATVGAAGFTAAAITGGVIAGSAAFGVGSLLTNAIGGGDAPSFQPSQQSQQSASDIVAQSNSAAEDQRKDIIRAKRRKTVLTGPTGLLEEADTGQKTLLGA